MSAPARVQGLPITDIAAEYGTPVFVYDTTRIAAAYGRLRTALPAGMDVFYSLKANPNVSVCGYLRSLGAGAEVSSHAELETALAAGVAPADIIFLGPGKSVAELRACVQHRIHAVVCESVEEVRTLDAIAGVLREPGDPVSVMVRVNPDFSTKGSGLTMGGKPRQFGIDTDVLAAAADVLAGLANVRIAGVHAYMGTRFLDHADVVHNTREILAAAGRIADRLGIPLETVDVGGGIGVAYFDNETDPDIEALGAGLTPVVRDFLAARPGCRVIMELGRYLVAESGVYVVTVRQVKRSADEWFLVADGGTNHHTAAGGVGSFARRNFPMCLLNRTGEAATHSYSISGPLCTPNDLIAKRVALPPVRVGDLIGIRRSGAYGPTASPGLFLSHGYPAEVLVHDGRAHLVRDRDTVKDLLDKQHLVAFEEA